MPGGVQVLSSTSASADGWRSPACFGGYGGPAAATRADAPPVMAPHRDHRRGRAVRRWRGSLPLALRPCCGPVYLRLSAGHRVRMPVYRWHAQPAAADKTVLERCVGSVLDVGCGPGRLCRELLGRGVFALGVDIAPRAVALPCALDGRALCRSIFDRLSAERDWQTLLLIDGNIGIQARDRLTESVVGATGGWQGCADQGAERSKYLRCEWRFSRSST